MKKYFCLLLFCAILLGLTGCGANKLTCTYEEADNEGATYEFKFDSKDKVTEVSIERYYVYPDEDEAKEDEEYYKSTIPNEKGFTYSVKRNGKKLTLKQTADISKVESDYLDGMTLEKSEIKSELESSGYKCK